MALYATCMPLPSDTFHDKLFACDQGGHPDYDHDREEVLWLLLTALFSLRLRQPCDRGQRGRLTQRFPVKEISPSSSSSSRVVIRLLRPSDQTA